MSEMERKSDRRVSDFRVSWRNFKPVTAKLDRLR